MLSDQAADERASDLKARCGEAGARAVSRLIYAR